MTVDGIRCVVSAIGRSPTPGDPRPCAVLVPLVSRRLRRDHAAIARSTAPPTRSEFVLPGSGGHGRGSTGEGWNARREAFAGVWRSHWGAWRCRRLSAMPRRRSTFEHPCRPWRRQRPASRPPERSPGRSIASTRVPAISRAGMGNPANTWALTPMYSTSPERPCPVAWRASHRVRAALVGAFLARPTVLGTRICRHGTTVRWVMRAGEAGEQARKVKVRVALLGECDRWGRYLRRFTSSRTSRCISRASSTKRRRISRRPVRRLGCTGSARTRGSPVRSPVNTESPTTRPGAAAEALTAATGDGWISSPVGAGGRSRRRLCPHHGSLRFCRTADGR